MNAQALALPHGRPKEACEARQHSTTPRSRAIGIRAGFERTEDDNARYTSNMTNTNGAPPRSSSLPASTNADVHALLSALSDPSVSLERAETLMAAWDGRELEALPTAFAWLHDAVAEDEIHAVTRLLLRWRDTDAGRVLPRVLRAMVGEAEVGDLNKIAAAGLLAVFGEPLHDADLAAYVQDPGAVKKAALRRVLDPRQGRLAIVNTIDHLAEREAEDLLPLIDDLAALGEPMGARLLAPLAHHVDPEIAVSAVAALDQLAAWRAGPAIAAVATNHPDEGVRTQAALTARRLDAARPSATAARPPLDGLAIRHARWEDGRSVLLISAPNHDQSGVRELITLHLAPGEIIAESAVLERVAQASIDEVESTLTEAGARIEDAPIDVATELLERATAHTLRAPSSASSMGWLAWRELVSPMV